MYILILLLLALDLRVLAFYEEQFKVEDTNQVKIVNYDEMGQGECPKIKEPLCATNGEEYLYFHNKCLLEVRNYERLLQGLQEYFECPLDLCNTQCPPCGPVYDLVCAVEQSTGQKEQFYNPCEVQRRICNTGSDWQIISQENCGTISDNEVFSLKSQDPECPELCTLEYKPICARFMTLEKEFSNECELKTTICQTKQEWIIVKQGPCEGTDPIEALDLYPEINNCPIFCTLEYSPICAKFGNDLREFANKCELETTKCYMQQDWQIVKNGPCTRSQNSYETKALEWPQKPQCPKVCTLEYEPICAKNESDVREFANKCELESLICETQQEWHIINYGPCSSEDSSLNMKHVFALLTKPECPEFCTLEYRPLCAKFNHEQREFFNPCTLKRTICKTKENWQVVHQGTCNSQPLEEPKCPKFCSVEYRPLCAKFNNEFREFSNPCTLEGTICRTKENWQFVNEGKCLLEHNSQCPKICTLDYRPICAKFNNELREFPNKCELLKENCETDKDWEIVNLGRCVQNSKSAEAGIMPPSAEECPKICSRDYTPLCAELKRVQREFPNKCEFQRRKCESSENWEIVNLGTCPSISPISAASSAAVSNDCPKFCTKKYIPLCAQLQGQLREFPNKCEFLRYKCESNENWKIVNLGTCPTSSPISTASAAAISSDCPKFCTREYIPLCAKLQGELREFPNKCEFLKIKCESNENWEIVNLGTCPSSSPITAEFAAAFSSDCPKFCPGKYIPLCAKLHGQLKEFPNKCEFLKFKCESNENWEIVNLGTCPTISAVSATPATAICPKICTREYIPLCAQLQGELKEFPNKCEFLRIKCETNEDWEIVNLGTCPSISSISALSSTECPQFCTREYIPLCAQLDQELREFSNKCEFQRTNCALEKKWEIVNLGTCPTNTRSFQEISNECPEICTEDLKPVCAEFEGELKEFANKCDFERTVCQTNTDWILLNEGPCPEVSKDGQQICPKFCTREFNPVCGRFEGELREFPNHCEFQRSVCETKIDWELINDGPCLIQTAKSFSINLQPLCATDGKLHKIFHDLVELQEEIKNTGKAWSLDHIDNCLNPLALKSTITKLHISKPSPATLNKFKYSGSTSKPYYYSSTTPKSLIGSYTQPPYSYSTEAESKEVDDSSTGYNGDNVSHYSDEYYEDSEEDDISNSWEDEEEEDEEESEEYDKTKNSYEIERENSTNEPCEDSYGNMEENKRKGVYNTNQNSENKYSDPYNDQSKSDHEKKDNYDKDSKDYQQSPSEGQRNHEAYSSKPNSEIYKENNPTDHEQYSSKAGLLNPRIPPQQEKNERKGFIKLIQEQIRKIFVSQEQDGKKNNEMKGNMNQNKPNYENKEYTGNLPNIKESLEANISCEDEEKPAAPNNNQESHDYKATGPEETQPKFGVYSHDAYDLAESKSKYSVPSEYNQDCNDLNSNNKMEAHNAAKIYQENQELYKEQYSEEPPANNDLNVEHNVHHIYLNKTNVEKDNNEETTAMYSVYEDAENHLNYTKREYNTTNTKKGEIYNGVVYKAPVYDAPTYNFIYTAPNHNIVPLTASNNPFLNMPQNLPYPADLSLNPPLEGAPLDSMPSAYLPFNPVQFLSSLAAMSSQYVAATPSLAMENGNTLNANNQNQEINANNPSLSNLPLDPFAVQILEPNIPQMQTSTHQGFPNLFPFNNLNTQMPNLMSYIPNHLSKENAEVPVVQQLPLSLPPIYHNPVDSQPGLAIQSSPILHNQPSESALNLTVLNKMLESLKTITNK